MIYCYRCGVQLDDDAEACPLCHTPVPTDAEERMPAVEPERFTPYPGTSIGNGDFRWDSRVSSRILTALLLPPIIPLLAIWYAQEPGMPWVLWTSAVLGAGWLVLVPLRRISRWPVAYSVLVGLIGAAMTVGVDATWGPVDWSLQVAAPVALLAAISVAALAKVTRRFSDWGLPALATATIGSAVVWSVTDGLINRFYGEPFIGAAFALLVLAAPISAVAFYLHYGLRVRVDLRKLFHF